mmetsp:Transcript_32757/g.102585  ORF Transcript_32757/g.102585 Transcript_32757/m.102585 type:complete len:549 (+) Transcript_32757:2-1648(+)
MNCVRGCVLHEDFKGNHAAFSKEMRPVLEELRRDASQLMYAVLAACRDGRISKEESGALLALVDQLKGQQSELVGKFHQAAPDVSMDLAEECIFAFALSFWARKVADLAERMAERSEGGDVGCVRLNMNTFKELLRSLWNGLADTWSPRRMFEVEHLKFCLRNMLSISFVFMLSYFRPSGSVFKQYSSTMAGTLTLLIVGDGTHQIGSMIYKNTQRLLGVVLGKVLPIIITSSVALLPCRSDSRFLTQAATTWLYVFLFTYIYYSSQMWGYVGCLIAGFGVYTLLVPCSGDPSGTFQARYEEIGAVTFAIFVQAIIHGLLSRHSPAQLELAALGALGEALVDGYEAFFASDLSAMQAAAREADTQLAKCQALLNECDPKLEVASCGAGQFHYELCAQVVKELEYLLGEFNLLIVAAKDWIPNEAVRGGEAGDEESPEDVSDVLQTLNSRPAMAAIRQEFMHSLRKTLELFQMLMTDSGVRDIESMRASMDLDAAPALYKELAGLGRHSPGGELTNDLRARLTVGVRALENSEYHLYKITERCLKDCPS